MLRALRPPSYDIHGELEEMKMEFESLKNVEKVELNNYFIILFAWMNISRNESSLIEVALSNEVN